jgi:hypothetical protein
MSTIFPLSASVNQEFDGYRFNGTSWDIIGQEYNPTVYSGTEPSGAKAGDIWIDSSTDVPSISPETILTINAASATYQTVLSAGTGLTINSSTVSVNPGAMLNQIVGGTSGNSYGLVGTSSYLDVKDTNGYNKEIELDIAAVESQLVTDGFLTNSSASATYATKTGGTFSGNITAPEVRATTKLVAQTAGGDEGGEILLGKAATNTTLAGDGITIDVYQNRLRIFEQGGDARGVSIDISNTSNGVGTELTPGLGGVPFRMAAGIATVGSNSPVSVTFPASRFSVAPVVTVTGNSGWAWISNLTSTGVVVYQTTSWGGASQAGSMYWTAVQMTSGAAGG